MKTKLIIYGSIALAIVIQILVMSLVITGQRNKIIKLKYQLEQCEEDKNLTKQSVDKYLNEAKKKDNIIKNLSIKLNKIKGTSNEEIVDNYTTLWNDLL